MIKITDALGASVILSSYLFVLSPPRDPIALFVAIPLLFGIILSTVGLTAHDGKKWARIYASIVAVTFVFTFIFMFVHIGVSFALFHAVPALIAASSLIMAYFAGSCTKRQDENRDAYHQGQGVP
ncbi:hypothetical protein K0U27_05050 [archaeon]|nr:hypothetical protein [archaeon]